MNGQKLSKHKRRQLKLEQKKEAKIKMQQNLQKKQSTKKIITYGVIGIAAIAAIAWFFLFSAAEPVDYDTSGLSFPLGNVHWHATPIITVCGQNVPILMPVGSGHFGSSLLHTHDDAKIHIEGTVSDPSQITLGLFMANIRMNFSETTLIDKENGDLCPNGQAGKVKLLVNGAESSQYGNYIIRENDIIEMKFE